MESLGRKHCYLVPKEECSCIALGSLIRAIGTLNVAYINKSFGEVKTLFENLSLNSNLKNIKKKISFIVKKKKNFEVSLLPDLEIINIPFSNLIKHLQNWDLIIIDNAEEIFTPLAILNLINRLQDKEIMIFLNNKKKLEELHENFNLVSEIRTSINKCLYRINNTSGIIGNGKGKTTYSYGLLLKKLIKKEACRFIAFDKGGDFYSEKLFFEILKRFSKNNKYYDFDYVYTGAIRFTGKKFRIGANEEDKNEALEGLRLLKTVLRKPFFVIADELINAIRTGLITLDQFLEIIENSKGRLVLTGRSKSYITKYLNIIIEVKEVKHYLKEGKGVIKGIDY